MAFCLSIEFERIYTHIGTKHSKSRMFLFSLPEGRTKCRHGTSLTLWFPGTTGVPSEPYHPVAEIRRTLRRNQRTQILFHLHRILGLGQPQPSGNADKMGIRHNGRLSVHITENEIGCFSPYAGQRQQIFHIVRHYAAEILQQLCGHLLDTFGLHMIESAGTDDLFQILNISRCQGFQSGIC